MDQFLQQGFELKEDIIKQQHNCKANGFWANKSKDYNFLLIMHEHLFVFPKKLKIIFIKKPTLIGFLFKKNNIL